MINAFGAVGRVLEAALPSRKVLRVSGSDTLTFLQVSTHTLRSAQILRPAARADTPFA